MVVQTRKMRWICQCMQCFRQSSILGQFIRWNVLPTWNLQASKMQWKLRMFYYVGKVLRVLVLWTFCICVVFALPSNMQVCSTSRNHPATELTQCCKDYTAWVIPWGNLKYLHIPILFHTSGCLMHICRWYKTCMNRLVIQTASLQLQTLKRVQ